MKKLNITKEQFNRSRYFKNKYGKLEYVSESGRLFKTNKGKVLMFKESAKFTGNENWWRVEMWISNEKELERNGWGDVSTVWVNVPEEYEDAFDKWDFAEFFAKRTGAKIEDIDADPDDEGPGLSEVDVDSENIFAFDGHEFCPFFWSKPANPRGLHKKLRESTRRARRSARRFNESYDRGVSRKTLKELKSAIGTLDMMLKQDEDNGTIMMQKEFVRLLHVVEDKVQKALELQSKMKVRNSYPDEDEFPFE